MSFKELWFFLVIGFVVLPSSIGATSSESEEDEKGPSAAAGGQPADTEGLDEDERRLLFESDGEEEGRSAPVSQDALEKIVKELVLTPQWLSKQQRTEKLKLRSDEILEVHLEAQNTFFKHDARASGNPKIQDIIINFEKQYDQWPKNRTLTPIDLTNISSRERIVLFRTVSEMVRYEEYNPKYFSRNQWGATSQCQVHYISGKTQFSVQYNPTESQPGNIFTHNLPLPNDRYECLEKLSRVEQTAMAKKILRKKRTGKPFSNLLHEQFSLIFDLEIARRLPEDKDLYAVSVASAITWYLEGAAVGKQKLSKLFEITGSDMARGYPYFYGPSNPFQGLLDRRAEAIKFILSSQKMSISDILSKYRTIYGAESPENSDAEDD